MPLAKWTCSIRPTLFYWYTLCFIELYRICYYYTLYFTELYRICYPPCFGRWYHFFYNWCCSFTGDWLLCILYGRRISYRPIKIVRSWYIFDSHCTNLSNFTHLKLWVAAARHNFKWLKITHIYLIEDQICFFSR